jgi:hypothetical protein
VAERSKVSPPDHLHRCIFPLRLIGGSSVLVDTSRRYLTRLDPVPGFNNPPALVDSSNAKLSDSITQILKLAANGSDDMS